jgi:hypothetical protein
LTLLPLLPIRSSLQETFSSADLPSAAPLRLSPQTRRRRTLPLLL